MNIILTNFANDKNKSPIERSVSSVEKAAISGEKQIRKSNESIEKSQDRIEKSSRKSEIGNPPPPKKNSAPPPNSRNNPAPSMNTNGGNVPYSFPQGNFKLDEIKYASLNPAMIDRDKNPSVVETSIKKNENVNSNVFVGELRPDYINQV